MSYRRLNPVGSGTCAERLDSGIHEVPCCVNPVALLRVAGLAEKYLAEHPEDEEGFRADLEACQEAGEIYSMVWERVNRSAQALAPEGSE
jgi:hypothetical protein